MLLIIGYAPYLKKKKKKEKKPPHPGGLLLDLMDQHDISWFIVAKVLELTVLQFDSLIRGQYRIDERLANKLGLLIESPRFWRYQEEIYRSHEKVKNLSPYFLLENSETYIG